MRSFIYAAILSLISSQASADWQYTKWGMSPEDVISASGGIASRSLPENHVSRYLDDNQIAKLAAPYVGDGVSFSAIFIFNEKNGLARVDLIASKTICDSGLLVRKIRGSYGAPDEINSVPGASFQTWWDRKNNNEIHYSTYKLCSLSYRQLNEPGKKGGL